MQSGQQNCYSLILHLKNATSSTTYSGLSSTDSGANLGQPDATFMSDCGR